MAKKIITFEENEAALTYKVNGDININPKFVAKFGYIEAIIDDNGDIKLDPQDFTFDCRGEGSAIKFEKREKRSNVIELIDL